MLGVCVAQTRLHLGVFNDLEQGGDGRQTRSVDADPSPASLRMHLDQ